MSSKAPVTISSGNYIYSHCLHVSVFKLAGVEDWRDKVVYLCADVASMNLGKDNGVGAKLCREVKYLIAFQWSRTASNSA